MLSDKMADDIEQDTTVLENAAMSYILHGTTHTTKVISIIIPSRN